jgi:hypothetical protein
VDRIAWTNCCSLIRVLYCISFSEHSHAPHGEDAGNSATTLSTSSLGEQLRNNASVFSNGARQGRFNAVQTGMSGNRCAVGGCERRATSKYMGMSFCINCK